MVKIGKLISRLIFLGLFGSWFVFTIWGIAKWNSLPAFLSQTTIIALLYVPLFIGMFILFVIFSVLGSLGGKKKKDKKEEETDWAKKISGFFSQKGETETKIDGKDIEAMIPKDVVEKITKFIKEKAEEES